MRHTKAGLLVIVLLWFQPPPPLLVMNASAMDPVASPDVPLPTYKPRRDAVPRSRIGGQMRGASEDAPVLVALVPDHVAFTLKQAPALCWYLSKDTSRPLTITVVDSRGIRPIFERALPDLREAGIHCIRLNDNGLVLKEQEQYRWFVTLVLDPAKPSKDVVAGGMIERIPYDEACMLDMPCSWSTCEIEAVYRYAEAGLWYDTIACLVDLLKQNQDKVAMKRMLDHLLRQAGIDLPG